MVLERDRSGGTAGLLTAVDHPPLTPFPWAALDALSRFEAASLRDARRWASAHLGPGRLVEGLGLILGVPVAIRVRRTELAAAARSLPDAVGVLLVPSGAPTGQGVLLEVEVALAATIASRTLRRPSPILVKAAMPSESIAGAVAAVVAAAARRASTGGAFEVRTAGPASALQAELLADGREGVAVTLTVLLGDEAYAARVVVGRHLLQAAPPPPWKARSLSALGPAPLAIPIVACAVASTVADVASLGPGDVLLPGSWLLTSSNGGLVGPVFLSAPRWPLGVRAELVEGGQLVLRGQAEPLEATMTDAGGEGALVGAIGEVPVVVRVEVGEAVMAARDWAALGPGDVIGLGRRVGDHVLLRVGGVPVARGELVAIEGEVGVRIVERLGEETTSR